ncbi:MAG: AAA family ATPase [Candidatus Methanofastidiosia archaeon]|jgi:DNA repair exonuclease SbcCD ATPase subunit
MKIKEFLILKYGPVSNTEKVSLGDFNLFYGKNEEGKTLTIDSLVKLLFGRESKYFERIDRVKENPEGYVIIEDEKSQEMKFPEMGDLTQIIGLTWSECCCTFIIRNSDLSINREDKFYTDVTDKLTGLRTKDISEIINNLRDIGKITPGGSFSNSKENQKLKERIDNSKDLIKDIEKIAKKGKEEKFDELEKKLVKYKDKIENIDKQLKDFDNARKREKYEQGKETLNNLKNEIKEFNNLRNYSEDNRQLWRDSKRDIEENNKLKKQKLKDLQRNEKNLEKIKEELNKKNRNFEILTEMKKIIDNDINPILDNYIEKNKKFTSKMSNNKFFVQLEKISILFFLVSMIGYIVRLFLFFLILALFFLILFVLVETRKYLNERDKAWLEKTIEDIKLNLAKFKIDAKNNYEIISSIQSFYNEYSKRDEELKEIKIRKGRIEDKIKDLKEKTIPNLENEIKKAQDKINKLKNTLEVDFIDEFMDKYKLKQKYGSSIEKSKIILKNFFGEKSDLQEENIRYWQEEIINLEKYKNKAKNTKYDEFFIEELKRNEDEYNKKKEELTKMMSSFQDKMKEIERKVYKILQMEAQSVFCETLEDLKSIKNKLSRFISKNETKKDNILKTIKIFEEIEKEEREGISKLFGVDSAISKHFYEITDGFYTEVNINHETRKIEVTHKNGKVLEADNLSAGAYDQLYFSIRLALGKKLLKDKKGFFIMDDPFIKADPDRLQRQLDMLKEISGLGWQILYFSAKGEVKDSFKENIEEGSVKYIEV